MYDPFRVCRLQAVYDGALIKVRKVKRTHERSKRTTIQQLLLGDKLKVVSRQTLFGYELFKD